MKVFNIVLFVYSNKSGFVCITISKRYWVLTDVMLFKRFNVLVVFCVEVKQSEANYSGHCTRRRFKKL